MFRRYEVPCPTGPTSPSCGCCRFRGGDAGATSCSSSETSRLSRVVRLRQAPRLRAIQELDNSIDEVIVFPKLTRDEVTQIVDLGGVELDRVVGSLDRYMQEDDDEVVGAGRVATEGVAHSHRSERHGCRPLPNGTALE